MTEPDVPVVVEPEAAARVAELGMQPQFEQMLEHTRRSVTDLRRIDVWVAWPYDTGCEPGVAIEAIIGRPWVPEDETEDELGRWKVETFPPEVCEHFAILTQYGGDHAG